MDVVIRIFWQQKRLILLITLASLFVGSVCIWSSTAMYEAKAFITSPTPGDIAALNTGISANKTAPSYSVKSIYRVFIESLTSPSAQKAFNNATKPTSLIVKEEAYLAQKLSPPIYSVVAKAPTPAQAKDAVEHYINAAKKNAMHTIVHIFEAQKKTLAANLAQQIKLVREVAQREREDRLTRLNEALQIATALGIESPSHDSDALYMQGSNVLAMEIQKIADRQSNDAYTPGLRTLQSKYNAVHASQVSAAEVNFFRIDGTIEASSKPVSPRKQLIFILFLILGLSLGSAVAMACALVSKTAPETAAHSFCEGV